MFQMEGANGRIELREECVHQGLGGEVRPPTRQRGGHSPARRRHEERYVTTAFALGPRLGEAAYTRC